MGSSKNVKARIRRKYKNAAHNNAIGDNQLGDKPESQEALLKLFTDFEGGLPHHEADWKFKYMKMESRYEEEKMACVYNIMEKNKLRKETEDLQTQLKKLETTKERLEENEVLKTRIQKMETYICHLQLQNEEFKAQHEVMKMQCNEMKVESEDLKNQNEEVAAQNEEIKTENEELKIKLEELNIQNEEMKNEIFILKEMDEENEEKLKNELEKLANQNQLLKNENEDKEEKIENLRKSIKSLEDTLDQHQAKKIDVGQMKILVELLKIQIEMLNTNIEENEEIMKKMEEENIKLKTERTQLQNQNEELKTKIKAAEKEEVQDHQKILENVDLFGNKSFSISDPIQINPNSINSSIGTIRETYRLQFDFKLPEESLQEDETCLISLAGDSKCHGCSKDMQSFIIFKSVWSESKKTLFFTFRRDGLVFQEDYSFNTEDIPMEGENVKIKSRNEWHRVTLTQIEDEDEFRILIFFDSENIVDEPNDSPQTWSNSLIQSFNKSDSFLLNNLCFYTN